MHEVRGAEDSPLYPCMQDVTLGERGEVLDGNITQNGHYD